MRAFTKLSAGGFSLRFREAGSSDIICTVSYLHHASNQVFFSQKCL